jgi:Arc/MetJ-type ribon-helix-helix transcriptional regulator
MQVTLNKELETFIAEKVQNGGYANADEVVREALRDLKAKDDPPKLTVKNWRNCCWPPCVALIGRSPRNILINFAPVPEGRRPHDPDASPRGCFLGRRAKTS